MPRTLAASLLLALAWLPLSSLPARAAAAPTRTGGQVMAQTLYDFNVQAIDGGERSLADYRGRTVLVVNTASRCGFTPQYESLEALHRRFSARGFAVLAFPANDFLGQEPGTNAEIKSFCDKRYHTTFPLFAKISVRGKRMAPLYRWLTHDSAFPGDIPWNFTKFLVGPDGRVVARFPPKTNPESAEVTAAIEKLLPPEK